MIELSPAVSPSAADLDLIRIFSPACAREEPFFNLLISVLEFEVVYLVSSSSVHS